jgi:hypothetical protein
MHCSRWSLLVVGMRPLGGATVFHYVGVHYCSHVGHYIRLCGPMSVATLYSWDY